MKLHLLATSAAGLMACASSGDAPTSTAGTTTTIPSTGSATTPGFRPTGEMNLTSGDGGPVSAGNLPVPVRSRGQTVIAALHIASPTRFPNTPEEVARRQANEISTPLYVVYWSPRSGQKLWVEPEMGPGFDRDAWLVQHFGQRPGKDHIVGRRDDPGAISKDRAEMLRQRICAALDVLLPLFDDPSLPWTEAANKAAREVRDFFPVAAEPGLWPYYQAEGRELFAWVEENAPPGRAALPWEETR